MEPYIILDGVSKSFRSVEVLKPLSIEFEEGLIHGIVGRNGSGKTVMMKLILGFLKPKISFIITVLPEPFRPTMP